MSEHRRLHPPRQPAHNGTPAQRREPAWHLSAEQLVPEAKCHCHHACPTELSRAEQNGVPIDVRLSARQARHVSDPFYATPPVMGAVRREREHEIFARQRGERVATDVDGGAPLPQRTEW